MVQYPIDLISHRGCVFTLVEYADDVIVTAKIAASEHFGQRYYDLNEEFIESFY